MTSPFLEIPESEWVASNTLAFAVRDKYPVSEGHTLVIPRRLVETWFDASAEEQRAIFELVDAVKAQLDRELHPDGYNVGFNAGVAAGQTVMHLHVHVIPRYRNDMDDPRGGVRHVIPSKGNYLRSVSALATGGAEDPFARHVFPLIERAQEIAIVAAFVQDSGLDRLRDTVHRAVQRGARLRLLTGDYLGITQAQALETLLDWQAAFEVAEDDDAEKDDEVETGERPVGQLEARVVEVSSLPRQVGSFHPKSWRFQGEGFGVAFVGSSNISYAALGSGIEWNLRLDRDRDTDAYEQICASFEKLWQLGLPLTREWVEEYAARARERPLPLPPGELLEQKLKPLPTPHAAQENALARLREARAEGRSRALAVFATGLGKTLLAVLDYAQLWDESGKSHPPRLLFLAHRRELLLQAAGAFRSLLRERGAPGTVGWFAEASRELHADLVFASVAKLARAEHLEALRGARFDYVVVDEVHHAAASSYRKILDALEPGFLLGLTATPERADGADILGIFDDHVAYRAGIDVGIELGRLVPFRYFGVKDSIDYANIPWRNRRFDPNELAAAAQTEARMASLWGAWEEHRGQRTLIFCCSVAHANFVRGWLRARDVRAVAVHSDPSSDERTGALEDLASGAVDAVCAVDVLNEGVDVPSIDRVVMLRPTESSVVFLQQLGRGLRANPETGKDHLTVIDFVGNHRVFLDRLRALFSLGARSGAEDLRRLVAGEVPIDLPEGCSVEIELEAKELLSRLFRSDGADEVERAYREIAASRSARPRAGELYRMGYSPSGLRKRHGSWFEFVAGEDDLTEDESSVLEQALPFVRDLETTPMTKSFKMVTLQALIEHDALAMGMSIDELAARAHGLLRRDPRLLADAPEHLRAHELSAAQKREWTSYWRKNPIAAWTQKKKSARAWFAIDGDRFVPAWSLPAEQSAALAAMVAELVDLRLAQYRRRGEAGAEAGESFECKVTWNQRDPILKLPSRKTSAVPEGEIAARLEEGSVWTFSLMKEFCNVARPAGAQRNQLPDLLRRWFGPSAGQPGTSFRVRFEAGPDGWTVRPAEGAQVIAFPRRAVVAYPDLEAAAGHVASGSFAPEGTEVELPVSEADSSLFAVRVAGDSMEGGRAPLRRGDWAIFRLARGAPASAIEGHVVLVQVPMEAEGPAFQIKRVKRAGKGWALTSDNPEGPDFAADKSMVVIARLEQAFQPEQLAPERGAVFHEDEIDRAFGLEHVEARTGRFGGHLFLFVDGKGALVTPSHVQMAVEHRRPAETAFVLAKLADDRWRYLGVGRYEDSTARWRIPEVDARTWAELGDGGVSRPLPSDAQSRASEVVDALLGLADEDRVITKPGGQRARVVGKSARGGLRIAGEDGAFEERTVSLTDIGWVVVAAADKEEKGGLLDEPRVNRLRYLEGANKASTRYIDTEWALAAWERVRSLLPERTEVMQVRSDEGRALDARFELHRIGDELSLVFHSRGGTAGSAAERNTQYNPGLERLLARLLEAGAVVEDALVDSGPAQSLDLEERRLVHPDLSYPISSGDPATLRQALGRAMAAVGRRPGAKGSGNMTKRILLRVRWPSEEGIASIAGRLAGGEAS